MLITSPGYHDFRHLPVAGPGVRGLCGVLPAGVGNSENCILDRGQMCCALGDITSVSEVLFERSGWENGEDKKDRRLTHLRQ